MQETMLKIENVSKEYRLGQIGGTTLREELQRKSAKWRHLEDPTRKIGKKVYEPGETFMALDNVSLSLSRGERLGIIGHNGAGKSTLLKLISRITAPSTGDIWANGRVASMLEVGTGFHGELTGRENIYMNGAILGMKKKEIDSKIEDIIDFSECRQFIDTPVKRYSSGMYVKLAFSVAAHLDAEIMIMDEVLAVGDINFQQKCLKKMRDVAQDEGRTVLYVSHNMDTIRQLCDRCIVMDHGKIIFDGAVENGIEKYMARNEEGHKKIYNVRSWTRKPSLPNICRINEIMMEATELVQKEELKFTLKVFSEKPIHFMMLRFVLFDKSGMIVGTAYSENAEIYSGDNSIKYSFSTDQLAPDDYYVDLVLIEYSDGIQIRHDLVKKVLSFSVEEKEHRYNIGWLTKSWGHVVLCPLKVVK